MAWSMTKVELTNSLELEAKELGFKNHKEKCRYLFSHSSGWYFKNPGKSIYDEDVLAKYFKNPKEYLKEVNKLEDIPLIINYVYKG